MLWQVRTVGQTQVLVGGGGRRTDSRDILEVDSQGLADGLDERKGKNQG